MQLKPLYVVRFHYPDGWQVDLEGPSGTEEHHYYFAEGRCEGSITGRFRAGNHPRRRTDRTFVMDMQGFIEDGRRRRRARGRIAARGRTRPRRARSRLGGASAMIEDE